MKNDNESTTSKTGPKLTVEQRELILTLLAADYDDKAIVQHFKYERDETVTQQTVNYYRSQNSGMIAELRAARLNSALNKGFAIKENRVAVLNELAQEIYARRWHADSKGRCHNIKAFADVLADLAAETGGRKINVSVTPDIDAAVARSLEMLAAVVTDQIGQETGDAPQANNTAAAVIETGDIGPVNYAAPTPGEAVRFDTPE